MQFNIVLLLLVLMSFKFNPEHLVGLDKDTLEQVVSSSVKLLSLLRDVVAGQPFLFPVDILKDVVEIYQTHSEYEKTREVINDGFEKTYKQLNVVNQALQALSQNLQVLQATTAVIGVGTVAGVALSAVNLHQTLKLREDIKELKLEVKDGFIDLKNILKDQGAEIIKRIDTVAKDIKFEQHRLILSQAYSKSQQANQLVKTALSCQDLSIRNATFANAQLILSNAVADYRNPVLLENVGAAGYLRRVECAWMMEQAIAFTYQLQNQSAAVSDNLAHLQERIRQDCLAVIKRCESPEELDFIFPEVARINNKDLLLLELWQNHADWIQKLSFEERKLLANSEVRQDDVSEKSQKLATVAEPEEISLYNYLKQKSHYSSLRDQLLFMIKPDLRYQYESYITEQAKAFKYKGFIPGNWSKVSDLTVANLYWYFKQKNN